MIKRDGVTLGRKPFYAGGSVNLLVLKRLLLIAGLMVMSGCVVLYVYGIRYNTTKSIPLGFYKTSEKTPTVGDYVIFCPPDTYVFQEALERGYVPKGFCPGGLGKMMKINLAAKFDIIDIDDRVSVNGSVLPLSQTRNVDPSGRPLTVFRTKNYILMDREVLLMSDVSDSSYDARYFGPIDSGQIISVIQPIWTW